MKRPTREEAIEKQRKYLRDLADLKRPCPHCDTMFTQREGAAFVSPLNETAPTKDWDPGDGQGYPEFHCPGCDAVVAVNVDFWGMNSWSWGKA